MLGAIIGDVVGSVHEFNEDRGLPKPKKNVELIVRESTFTDDTVLTIAVMDWILHASIKDSYSVVEYFKKWALKYPNRGFGGRFVSRWLYNDNPKPYGSTGNGSGMRVSPVAYYARSMRETLLLSDLVTSVTHNSYEGIKGARVIALATFMALHGATKEDIRHMAEKHYPCIKEFDYEDLVDNYRFNELSKDTCPQAVYCFLISESFEDCLRTSLSIGGDSDTLCAMSCAIAEAYYKEKPIKLAADALDRLPMDMRKVIADFSDIIENSYLPDFVWKA